MFFGQAKSLPDQGVRYGAGAEYGHKITQNDLLIRHFSGGRQTITRSARLRHSKERVSRLTFFCRTQLRVIRRKHRRGGLDGLRGLGAHTNGCSLRFLDAAQSDDAQQNHTQENSAQYFFAPTQKRVEPALSRIQCSSSTYVRGWLEVWGAEHGRRV